LTSPSQPADSGPLDATLWVFQNLGERYGLRLYRVALFPDGSGETEFESPNPVETLVLKWENREELDRLLTGPRTGRREAFSARKKCTRCMLHERPHPLDGERDQAPRARPGKASGD